MVRKDYYARSRRSAWGTGQKMADPKAVTDAVLLHSPVKRQHRACGERYPAVSEVWSCEPEI